MRVITCNVNGLRSAAKKGFFHWLSQQDADIICLQEIRMQAHQLEACHHLPGYQAYFFDAEKKGYSGVAIYTRYLPDRVIRGLGWECADQEGRYIQLDFGYLSIASLYLPSGSAGDHRQQLKFHFLEHYQRLLEKQNNTERAYILCGDWNIAHRPIDLKNWKGNQKNSGFLPEERAWLDYIFESLGYVDAFRALNSAPEQYTWWSSRGRAREKNVGWRIDYQIISAQLKSQLLSTAIYKAQNFSDHAPLIVDYDIDLSN